MSRFWSEVVHRVDPYVPGEQPAAGGVIKLNTNENPYPPGESVLRSLRAEADNSLRLYPDPESSAVRAAVAKLNGLASNQVFVGNGSDEVLAHAFRALLQHADPVLFPDVTYSFYPVYCELFGIDTIEIPLDDSLAIDLDAYPLENGGIIFPNPNAPTGRGLPLAAIEALLQRNRDSVVIVDEAYVDFGAESAVPLIARFDNLLVVQTLSKSRSLAGLRVGFAMGHPDLIEALQRIKNSFNSYPLDRFAIAGAVAALNDRETFQSSTSRIIATRERLSASLAGLGMEVLPSQANFLFARHPRVAGAELAAWLRDRNILVRHFKRPRIDPFLRITIGTDAECDALVDALRERLSAVTG